MQHQVELTQSQEFSFDRQFTLEANHQIKRNLTSILLIWLEVNDKRIQELQVKD